MHRLMGRRDFVKADNIYEGSNSGEALRLFLRNIGGKIA